MWGFPLEFRKEDLPGGCVITTDRNLIAKADAVVFHLPDLPSVMEDEIDKREGQLWVGWSLECEENYSWTKDPRASVVEKEYGNKWIYSNSDGYFYYDGIISSGGRAEDKFLKSIMLSGDVDFAETKKTVVYYSTMTTGEPSKITNNPETGWAVAPNTGIPNNATYNKTVVTGNGKYASANYTLTITVQVYQANKQAVAGTAFETVVPETYALLD